MCRSYKYAGYQRTFSLLETLNIVTLLVSVQITHWILNYKFWNYGNEVINYLTVYGSHLSRGKRVPIARSIAQTDPKPVFSPSPELHFRGHFHHLRGPRLQARPPPLCSVLKVENNHHLLHTEYEQ